MNARFQINGDIVGNKIIYDSVDYAKMMSKAKICITTTGPADLVSPRYFEIMACNSGMIICNRHSDEAIHKAIYGDMIIEDFNCVMFSDIQEFVEKVDYYLKHDNERMKIVSNAYKYFLENLTIEKNVQRMLDTISLNMNE